MTSKFDLFVQRVKHVANDEIVCMAQFGSCKGIRHPELSDIDLLVLTKNTNKVSHLVKVIREVEKDVLHIKHSEFTDILEEDAFASNDFKGIHLIIIGRDEIDHNFNPKSLKLKLITSFLISRPIFVYNVKHHYKILIGEDLVKDSTIPKLRFVDRLIPFLDSSMFLLVLPFIAYNKKTQFKIWCFKVIKFFYEYIETYSKIQCKNDTVTYKDLRMSKIIIEIAHKGRYDPSSYKENPWKLYIKTWIFVFQNLPFLIRGPLLRSNN